MLARRRACSGGLPAAAGVDWTKSCAAVWIKHQHDRGDVATYRIVMEALANAARHSGSDVAAARLVHGNGALAVEVRDGGTTTGPASTACRCVNWSVVIAATISDVFPDDCRQTSEVTEAEIFDYLRDNIRAYQERWGNLGFEMVESHLGRRVTFTYLVDGEVRADLDVSSFMFDEHREWAHKTFGRPWFTAHAVVTADGGLSCSFEYELPPEPAELRTVSGCATDLLIYPRPPGLVPGWMKVELALAGAWDLVSDRLTVNKRWEPKGRPQTAASVGVPLPAGAERAWTPEVFEGSPDLSDQPAPADVEAEEWVPTAVVLPADRMVGLRARWDRLAELYGPLVQVLAPKAGPAAGEEQVGVAPVLAEVVAALPGVALGGVVLNWPQEESEGWPELGDQFTYQPVWGDGREAVVVRIDAVTGAPGEVVYLDDGRDVATLAPDVVAWWEALTSWAEDKLVALRSDLGPDAADEEELSMLLEEALEYDFQAWLDGSRLEDSRSRSLGQPDC